MRLLEWLPPALSKPRFRIFAAGQLVSILGSWIQQIALAWLVYRLTGSVLLLGLTGFMLQIPHLVIAPFAGLLGDRLPRVRLLLTINALQAVLATALAALALGGVTSVAPYLALAGLFGVAHAFEAPVRQALLLRIVEERSLLASAIAMNSVIFNSGRMIGPAVAGALLAVFSEGVCFAVNAVSFLAIMAALLAMRLPDPWPDAATTSGLAGLQDAARHLATVPVARLMLPVVVVIGAFATPYQQLMPSLAVEFFAGSASTVGVLMTATGVGALVSATVLSFQRGYRVQLALARAAPFVLGTALLGLAWSRSLALSMACLAMIGASVLATSASTNTLLQQSVDDSWRGRVIGFYIMAFLGVAPLGHLLAGWIASHIGLAWTLTLDGAIVLLAAATAHARLAMRPQLLAAVHESLQRPR